MIKLDSESQPVALTKKLKAALANDRNAKLCLDALVPSHEKSCQDFISEARQAKSRERQSWKAGQMLALGRNLS